MRPKVVILTLVAAFGLLGIIAVLKGVTGKSVGNTASADATNATSLVKGTNGSDSAASGGSNNGVVVSDEMRAAVIAKEIERIQELVGEVDGTNNPIIIAALVDKVAHPETEVRKAALAALVQMNDTNVLPGLEQAAANLKDPRAKVDVMDTIDYLKLPSIMPAVQPPETLTNNSDTAVDLMKVKMNPNFLHKKNAGAGTSGGKTAPASTPASQPQ